MNWQEVCEHPSLQDLPFKIELNQWGQIVMSPTTTYRSLLLTEISVKLNQLQSIGQVLLLCPIQMSNGSVYVVDILWMSEARFNQHKHEDITFSIAPEICVEVMLPGIHADYLIFKSHAYFANDAEEVWISDLAGNLSFYNANGKIVQSALIPAFPQQIKIL
jgi:Uma2 family endonuclease